MKRRKFIVTVILAALLTVPAANATPSSKKKKSAKTEQEVPKPKKDTASRYDKLLKGAISAKGDFITLHKVNGKKVYLEYPVKHLGRRMLVGSTVSEVSDPSFVNVGYKHADPIHLQVNKCDTLLVFSKPNTSASLNSNDEGLKIAFRKNFIPKLYRQYPILAYNKDSTTLVVEITSLLQDMGPKDGMIAPSKEKDMMLSFGKIKAFEDNASIEIRQNVTIEQTILIFKFKIGEISAVSNVSFLLLPEEPMKPRIQDSRIGVFWSASQSYQGNTTPKYEISVLGDGLRPYFLANRWRVEPIDIAAWKRGEKVAVRKPIVWYVDNAFPAEWRGPIREGVLMWNRAFEEIGLKNVIQVHDFPTKEENPEFDPDNLKYSCLRYSPCATMNAMGPSWVDPVTGEILNASVIVWNDIVKLINNWRFVQTAQVDERVRTKKMPKEIIDESIVYVVSHEIGHTLGLMHNMAASAAYPVDSLRSETFTAKYGTTPSIMDYARFNYVVQPDDKGVKLTPPDLGIYDKYVIKWLYEPVPDAKDMWEEAEIADRLIDEKAGDPLYRYGRQQFSGTSSYTIYDPSALGEDLGDDPIKAGDYGIANLKYILPNMSTWIDDDQTLDHRQNLYVQIVNQYYRYLTNVLYQIGGIYLYDVKDGTPGQPAIAVNKARQKASLVWIMKQLRSCDWINQPELTRKFALHTDFSTTLCSMIASNLTTTIPSNVTLSSHIADKEGAYTIREFYNDLYNEVFQTSMRGGKLTPEEKVLQRMIVTAAAKPMITAKNAQKFTNDEMPLQPACSALPSYEELVFQGKIHPELAIRFGDQMEQIEERYGKGTIAASLSAGNEFGEARLPFQRALKIDKISEIEPYNQTMIGKIHTLAKAKMASAPTDDRAHYEYLWRMTSNALNN